MISIIVIGYNEGWRLTKSLQSAYNMIKLYPNYEFDIIYVDSRSTDDSLERAKDFPSVRIFEITGKTNAAIARNVGAKEAKGEILFFIDADMEIENDFLKYAIVGNKLNYDCLTGHLDDYLYDEHYQFLGKKTRTYKNTLPQDEERIKTNGGFFLIKKEIWQSVGGMRTKYRFNEDIDLFFRLSRKGVKIIRIPHLIAKHHTIDHTNEYRMWVILKQGGFLFAPLIFREHLGFMYNLKQFLRAHYTAFLLLLSILSFFINFYSFLFFLTVFVIVFLSRVTLIMQKSFIKKNKIIYFIESAIVLILKDFGFWLSFLFYNPNNPKESYKKVIFN